MKQDHTRSQDFASLVPDTLKGECEGSSRHAAVGPGDQFDRITVVGLAGRDQRHRKCWACRCQCGREWNVRQDTLIRGAAHSCGRSLCYRADVSALKRSRHGLARSAEYGPWCGMVYRCENPKAPNYKRYGARGITVCERWHDIKLFVADMGPRPSLEHSIDRRDNDGNYEPGNCYWATPDQQAANTSITVKVTVFGDEVSLNEAWKRLGLNSSQKLYRHMKKTGASAQEAVDFFGPPEPAVREAA